MKHSIILIGGALVIYVLGFFAMVTDEQIDIIARQLDERCRDVED